MGVPLILKCTVWCPTVTDNDCARWNPVLDNAHQRFNCWLWTAIFAVIYSKCFFYLSNVLNVLFMYFNMMSWQQWNHLLCVLHRVIILSDSCQLPFCHSYVSRTLYGMWLVWFPGDWGLLLMNHYECWLLSVPVHCFLIIIFSHWHSYLSLICSFFSKFSFCYHIFCHSVWLVRSPVICMNCTLFS
jgi:hypothetical protein